MSGPTDAFALYEGKRRARNDCRETAVYASYAAYAGEADAYAPFCDEAMRAGVKNLYVPTLDLPDKTLDALIDYALENRANLSVTCSQTLTEAGKIDSRFGKSPVMLLHEFGLLGSSAVVSGVYLDKEDLALLAQESVPLIVLPSSDAGAGHGIAPVRAALSAGVRVRIGTGTGLYNTARSVLREAALLRLLVSAQMNRANALSAEEVAELCGENMTAADIGALARQIENQ